MIREKQYIFADSRVFFWDRSGQSKDWQRIDREAIALIRLEVARPVLPPPHQLSFSSSPQALGPPSFFVSVYFHCGRGTPSKSNDGVWPLLYIYVYKAWDELGDYPVFSLDKGLSCQWRSIKQCITFCRSWMTQWQRYILPTEFISHSFSLIVTLSLVLVDFLFNTFIFFFVLCVNI